MTLTAHARCRAAGQNAHSAVALAREVTALLCAGEPWRRILLALGLSLAELAEALSTKCVGPNAPQVRAYNRRSCILCKCRYEDLPERYKGHVERLHEGMTVRVKVALIEGERDA